MIQTSPQFSEDILRLDQISIGDLDTTKVGLRLLEGVVRIAHEAKPAPSYQNVLTRLPATPLA